MSRNTNLKLLYSQNLLICLMVQLGLRPTELKVPVIFCHVYVLISKTAKLTFLLSMISLLYIIFKRRILFSSMIYADRGLAIALKMAPAWVENVNEIGHTATNSRPLQRMITIGLPTATQRRYFAGATICVGLLSEIYVSTFSLKMQL